MRCASAPIYTLSPCKFSIKSIKRLWTCGRTDILPDSGHFKIPHGGRWEINRVEATISRLWVYSLVTTILWLLPQAANFTLLERSSVEKCCTSPCLHPTSSRLPWQCWPNSPHPHDMNRPDASSGGGSLISGRGLFVYNSNSDTRAINRGMLVS